MTEANIKRLVGKLSQMRGAALKLGQFLSIQGMLRIYILYRKKGVDFSLGLKIPTSYPQKWIRYSAGCRIARITCPIGKWRFVRPFLPANPPTYLTSTSPQQVLSNAIPSYSTHFTSFSRLPFAAASIGQVHTATLSASSSPTGKEEEVAVKIQFPGVVKSIESDLGYMYWLLGVGGVLPRGLFLDRTVQVRFFPLPLPRRQTDGERENR